jgi:hypothetical protein
VTVLELVDRGIVVRAELERLKTELKGIEARLQKYGLNGEHVELKDAEREGRRWLAHGSSLIVPVVFTADKIVQTFTAGSPVHDRILAAADSRLREFFEPSTTYKNLCDDGKTFRTRADEKLGKVKGPPFVTACLAVDTHGIPKSDVKVMWEDGEEVSGLKVRALRPSCFCGL